MLAFSGCTHGLSAEEADELTMIRENTTHWKVKEINSEVQRAKGYCPLTPKEVAMFLTALGYPSDTPIYIAAGEIYGGESHIADLRSRYPILMSKFWEVKHPTDKLKLLGLEQKETKINLFSRVLLLLLSPISPFHYRRVELELSWNGIFL
ncbi:O-fucosyltransferase 7 [Ancistrocladus abbreviatus]